MASTQSNFFDFLHSPNIPCIDVWKKDSELKSGVSRQA